MAQYDYDVIVIGGGSGGITASWTTSGIGKKTLVVEKNKLGGECTWNGCVPSKALIRVSKTAHEINHPEKYFLKYKVKPELDTRAALDYVHQVQQEIYRHESPEIFSEKGIDVLFGAAGFVDPHTIKVEGKKVTGEKFILATGTSPFVPLIPGIDTVNYLTNENVFVQDKIPASMIVLGGGPIGVELAQAWNRLGVRVIIVEMMNTLLFREEKEMSAVLTKALEEEGVTIFTDTKAVKVEQKGKQVALTVEQQGQPQTVEAEALLVAVGRKPNLEGLNLETAGVEYHSKGVRVNSRMQTSAKHIYAVGDIAGPYQFSHVTGFEGVVAGVNASLPFKRSMSYDNVLWATFTQPELARVGMTEEEAREKYGGKVRIYTVSYSDIDRSRTDGTTKGLAKYILDPKGYLAGAHIVGAHAGEIIHEAQLLKSLKIKFSRIMSVMHAYPTYSDIIRKAGNKAYLDELQNKWYIKLAKALKGRK